MKNPGNARLNQALWLLLFAGFLQIGATAYTALDLCALCGQILVGKVYSQTDEVSGETKFFCEACTTLPDRCFACSLPVKATSLKLSDSRHYCERDARAAVLDEAEIKKVCAEMKEGMDRTFSRFLTLPADIEIAVVDRVSLIAFKVPGNDYACPNILGYFNPQSTNRQINILSGLTRSGTRATCAHEYGHAWIAENVSTNRKATLSRDAEEGFCELLSYLALDDKTESAQKEFIEKKNAYTRGQIDLFIDAAQRHGLNEVLDWIRYGLDGKLDAAHPFRVKDVAVPASVVIASNELYTGTIPIQVAANPVAVRELPSLEREALSLEARKPGGTNGLTAALQRTEPLVLPTPAAEKIKLQGISGGANPIAIINNQTFAVGERHPVRLGKTNVLILCLQIRADSVRIRILSSGEEQEISLKSAVPAESL